MTLPVFYKFLTIVAIVVLGLAVGRLRWLGSGDVGRVLSSACFMVFAPALLFRTAARIDFAHLPWQTLIAYFGTVVAFMLVVYAITRRPPAEPAAPAVRAISSTFGNTVQVGIPIMTALFGEAGLQLHLAIVSMHALTLMTILTVLVELELAHAHARSGGGRVRLGALLYQTVRNTIIHPIILPVLCGLAWNATGQPLPTPIDELLVTMGSAVVPLSLLAIGMSLAHSGIRGAVTNAVRITLAKLVLQPAVVLVVGHWAFGLAGLPLVVMVLCAALPTGSNATMFSIRYRTLEQEVTTAVVISTVAFVGAAPLWVFVCNWLAP